MGLVPSRSRRRSPVRPVLWAAIAGALLTACLVAVDVHGVDAVPAGLAPALPVASGPTQVAAPANPTAPPVDVAAAIGAAEEAGERSGATIGVAVVDRASGELVQGAEAAEILNAASLAKLVVALDLVDRRRAGEFEIGERTTEELREALSASSDPAMNDLWSRNDGAAGVTRVAEELDLDDTTTPDDASQWGEVQTSARDMARVFEHVLELPGPDRDLVVGSMSGSPPTAADGFDQGYGLLDGSGAPVKQGWLCCLSDSVDLHTVGTVGDRWVVAVLTNQPRGYPRARETVNDVVRALRSGLGDTPTG